MSENTPGSVPTRQDVDRWVEELRAELWPSPYGQEVCDGLTAYLDSLTSDNAELREAGNSVADDLERAFDTLDKWEVHHMIGGKALADWRALTGPSEEE